MEWPDVRTSGHECAYGRTLSDLYVVPRACALRMCTRSAECGVGKGGALFGGTRVALEDGGLGRRGRSEGEGEWRPGLRPSSTLAGPLLVGDVGEGGAFRWRGAPTHRRRPAAEASGRIGVARDRRVASAQTHDSPR